MVEYELIGHIAVLTINRPEARNAVNGAVATGMEAGLDRLEEDDDAWVGILTGEGPVFSAGADLKVIAAGNFAEMATERGGFAGIVQRTRTKPLIAAVDGPALAGGTEIVLSCDLVVASIEAQFGIPEVKRSLVAAAGGLFRLPRKLPFTVALELTMTGDPIDAARAHHFGMVNELTEPGQAVARATDLAERIAVNAPLAVRESRRLVYESLEGIDDDEGIRRSGEAMMGLAATDDFAEGPKAFIEKRDPVWKGR